MNGTNILKLMLLLMITAGMASCSKDKGNYDYKTLDEVTIDMGDEATAYALLRFDTLRINPKVSYKGELVDAQHPQFPELKFSWELYPAQINRDVQERHVISEGATLKAELSQRELVWELLFTVTNTSTGVKAFSKFAVAITPALAEGWMVLYERNGNTDVGMITNNEISKTQTVEKVFLDIYSASNNGPMRGTPGSLIYSIANLTGGMRIYIQSNQDAAFVNLSTFEKVFTYDKGLFWTKPAVTAPALVKATESRKEFLINDNKIHVVDYTIIAPGDRAFNDALGGSYGTLAPWLASATSSAFDAIVYDQTNKRFMKVVSRGSEIIPINTVQDAATPFDVKNVGMEFVMADLGWNNWEHFVMKDATGTPHLLTANFREGETAFIGKGKYSMAACPEIADINSITAGYLGEVFYYSSSNHLYQFKYTAGSTEQLWPPPSGEKITNISLQKYYNTNRGAGILYDPKNLCKILYVATYNEGTQTGSVYQMGVNQTSGALLPGTEKKYTGFGKIKAMAWKPYIIR